MEYSENQALKKTLEEKNVVVDGKHMNNTGGSNNSGHCKLKTKKKKTKRG